MKLKNDFFQALGMFGLLPKTALVVSFLVQLAPAAIPPMPIISRTVPAFASSGTASYGQNAHYTTFNGNWCGDCSWGSDQNQFPAWLAYDLSGVPAHQRQQILLVWYGGSARYDMSVVESPTYGEPGPYIIEGNPAAGGGGAPASGWVTLATGPNPQNYSSLQHVITFTGYNWIRFNCLSDNPRNSDGGHHHCSIKFDIYDASGGITDDWIIYGNSITEQVWTGGEFNQLIHAQLPQYNPIWQGGGIGFMKASDGAATLLPRWLPLFPGRYVCLSYGTNDANMGRLVSQSEIQGFYDNYESMVKQILSLNKIPVIGTIIWSPQDDTIRSNLQKFNSKLAELKTAYPQIINGPDLYSKFSGHSQWFRDGLHPTFTEGSDTLRSLWVQWALKTVYSGTVSTKPGFNRSTLKPSSIAADIPSIRVIDKTVNVQAHRFGTTTVFNANGANVSVISVTPAKPAVWTARSPGVYFVKMNPLSRPWRIVIK